MECFKKFKASIRRNGILQYDRSHRGRILTIILNCLLLGVYVVFFITTLFSLFWAQPFEDLVDSIYFTTTALLCISWYCNFIYQREKYIALFNDLDATISKRVQNPTSDMIYQRTNKNVEMLTTYLRIIGVGMLAPVYAIPCIINSFFNYVFLDQGKESFQRVYPAAYPFEWRTPVGYVICILVQITPFYAAAETSVSVIVLFVGFCLFMADFASDLRENLLQLNENQIDKSDENSTITELAEMKKRFYDIILFHSNAREFVRRFSDMNIFLVSAFLLFTLSELCCLCLEINMDFQSGRFSGVLRHIMITVALITFLYVLCHFGNRTTQQFNDFQEAVFSISWYMLPLEMQKSIPMIISMAQKEVYIEVFGNIHCTREVFMKTMRASFSYFLVLRK